MTPLDSFWLGFAAGLIAFTPIVYAWLTERRKRRAWENDGWRMD